MSVAGRADLLFLKELIENGEIELVINTTYPLIATPVALRDADEGHGRSKTVITI